MKLTVKADTQETVDALRRARRDMRRALKPGLLNAARRALIGIHETEPHRSGRLAAATVAGATQRTGYIQVSGREAPYAGLLNFGGTRRDVIRPHAGRALSFGGSARAIIRTPRHYEAEHFLERGIERERDQIDQAILDAAADAFRSAGFDVK